MSKESMWIRCPKCGRWCYAEKKDFIQRLVQSFSQGDKKSQDEFGELGDRFGLKGLGKGLGRVMNAANYPRHAGEMLGGDKYRFFCECGHEFGTDDEEADMTDGYELYVRAIDLSDQFPSIKQPMFGKEQFMTEVRNTMAKVEHIAYIPDAKATLHDLLACCYYFFNNDSVNALIQIEKSLKLFDDPKSHVLKGLFMGKVVTPAENYEKMNELLKIDECQSLSYIDDSEVKQELKKAEDYYGGNFISIPANQRKFLVVTDDYTYLPSSFKVIKHDADLSGIKFKNGFANKYAIYICHPYKVNVYYPYDSYQTDLLEDQIDELILLLQCLGAKSISTANSHAVEKNNIEAETLCGKIGGEYKGVGANITGDKKNSRDENELVSTIQEKIASSSFNPDIPPYVPDGLAWYPHMDTWERLYLMRKSGLKEYSVTVSTRQTHLISTNEASHINADFNALVAKGNIDISKITEIKASENITDEWKLKVEFYPLSEYNNWHPAKVGIPTVSNNKTKRKQPIRNVAMWILSFAIIVLITIMIFLLK